MEATIRPISAGDDVSSFGPVHGADADEPRRRRSVVALHQGELVGVATALWSRRHTDMVQATGRVLDTHRRHGIGSALLTALEELAGGPLIFATEVLGGEAQPGDAAAPAFLRSRGYDVLVESDTVRIALTDEVERALAGAPVPTGVEIHDASLTSDLEELYEAIYAERHAWAGRYVPTPGTPWIRMAGEPLDGTFFVATDATTGRLLAATGLQTGYYAEGADAFLAPTGVLGRASDPTAPAILRALVARTVAAARASGITTVNVEHDTPYVELAEVGGRLPRTPVRHITTWTARRERALSRR